jgi:hypothetical protein
MTRQNKALSSLDTLIKELQDMIIKEKQMSFGHLQTIITQLCEIRNLIR